MYSTRYLEICCVKTVIYYEQIYNIYLLLLLIRMSKAKTTKGLRAPPALSPRQHQPVIPCDASCFFVSPSPSAVINRVTLYPVNWTKHKTHLLLPYSSCSYFQKLRVAVAFCQLNAILFDIILAVKL